MKHKYSLIFFGSSENSAIVLKELHKNFKVKLVVTAPPQPKDRKQTFTKTPIHEFALKNNIPVQTPEKFNSLFIMHNSAISTDIAIVADYAQKIPPSLLKIPKHGFLNLHPSLLPQYRGSTPAQAAILNGDKITGLTIFKIDENFDTGPIISWFKEKILLNDNAQTLYQRLFEIGSQVLVEILPSWIQNKIIPRKQENSLATYAPRLTRQTGFIPWNTFLKATQSKPITKQDVPQQLQSYMKKIGFRLQTTDCQLLERAIRAFYHWPGIWTIVKTNKGEKRLKILSVQIQNDKLQLNKVQLEGQNPSTFNQIKNQLI